MDEILDWSALEQSEALAAGRLSAEELMRATLAHIGRVNGAVNAIVSLRSEDELMAEARAADAAERTGRLHGIPIAIKDLANAEGLPTSMGSPVFAGQVAARDDLMVARLRAAGAIVIGKTNTPEFGLGSHTFNPVFGATKNPWDLARSAGGSSGGAAAALAARMLSVADGSDMMGSLRNPAGWNNVYGMRPSFGRVPNEPHGETFLHQLATMGPMARCPRDLAALLDVQSGADTRQPHGGDYAPVLNGIDADIKGRRIGWLGDWGGALPMDEGLLAHTGAGMAELAALGPDVEEVAPPFGAEALWESWITLRSWAVAGAYLPLLEQGAALKPEAVWEIERGRALSAMEVHRASVVRSEWFKAAARLFERYDALVLPSAQLWPFPVEWDWPKEIGGQAMDTYHRWMQVVVPVGLIGLPCVNLPLAMNEGRPAGMQIFAKRGDDGRLLQIAEAWHQAYGYAKARPDLI